MTSLEAGALNRRRGSFLGEGSFERGARLVLKGKRWPQMVATARFWPPNKSTVAENRETRICRGFHSMELGGLEPPTSWVRCVRDAASAHRIPAVGGNLAP